MILAFDVGNTETTIGLFDGERLTAHWRWVADSGRTPDEIDLQLRALLASREVAIGAQASGGCNGRAGSPDPPLSDIGDALCRATVARPFRRAHLKLR